MQPYRRTVSLFVVAVCTAAWVSGLVAQPRPTGEAVWAWNVTLAPAWFDPADTPAQVTPFGMLYALHWTSGSTGTEISGRDLIGKRPLHRLIDFAASELESYQKGCRKQQG